MAQSKITKKEMFAHIIALAEGKEVPVSAEEIVDFAKHEIDLLSKKTSNPSKTKAQKENEDLIEQVFDILDEVGEPISVTELMKVSDFFAPYSNQKISALLKKLVDVDRVVRITEGKKTLFAVKSPRVIVIDEDVEIGE